MEVARLPDLALVTCVSEPSDVFVKMGPPESNQEGPSRREDAFVSQLVMSIADDRFSP